MAKRELSSTLKNLKFMNRAVQREEKAKKEEEEAKANENFSSTTQTRKCIVIMEGNPPPGALKGRMSFLSFNPSIDKLNGESTDQHQPQVPATTSPDEKFADRESGSSQTQSEDFLNSSTNSDFNGDHKRKQPENVSEQLHPKNMALVPALHLRYKPFSSTVVQSQSMNYSSPLFLPTRSLKNPGTPLIARRRSFRVFNQLEKESIQKTVQDEQEKDVGVRAALTMLRFYKREISPLLPKSCRYVPSCSEYSMEAYKRYGVVKGTILTTWRLCRCNPLGGSGFDPPRWFGEERPPEE